MDALAARLPGLQPVAEGDWLRVDDAYAGRMAYRDQLIATRRDEVDANVLCYNDPELHQPRLEHERRPFDPAGPVYVRVERQSLMRLDAVSTVFGIHTYLMPIERLTPEQLANLPENVRRGGSMGETN
jgi:Protein of unknown function (DUF3445)